MGQQLAATLQAFIFLLSAIILSVSSDRNACSAMQCNDVASIS